MATVELHVTNLLALWTSTNWKQLEQAGVALKLTTKTAIVPLLPLTALAPTPSVEMGYRRVVDCRLVWRALGSVGNRRGLKLKKSLKPVLVTLAVLYRL